MPTLIRWWEVLRAPEVATWQQKHRVGWDVTDGRNGGAQRTVWGVLLMEMERLLEEQKQKIEGPWPWCWTWVTHFSFPRTILRLLRLFRAPEASAVRRMQFGAAPDHHGHLARVQVELFVFVHCSAGCVERRHKNRPVFEAEFFCG